MSPVKKDSVRIEVGHSVGRRGFLKTVGGAAAAATGLSVWPELTSAASLSKDKVAEDYVKLLYENLKAAQREKICFPFEHKLGKVVKNNWHIVPQTIGEFLNSDQQELVQQILKGITSEDGYERFQKSMKDDDGGLGNYSCAIFGKPKEKIQFVLTGRHVTLRSDGDAVQNTAFGGPLFYGHAVTGNEKPDHPGNVWWHQGLLANKLFESLDGKQREKALLKGSPADNAKTVVVRGDAEIPGLRGEDLSKDQGQLLKETMQSLLSMFRKSDVDEAVKCLERNGGFKKAAISFYKEGDIGSDKVWDRWKVEGPAFVWYFRGSPHVHTWVNIKHEAPREA